VRNEREENEGGGAGNKGGLGVRNNSQKVRGDIGEQKLKSE
jgi:hypothetical protein